MRYIEKTTEDFVWFRFPEGYRFMLYNVETKIGNQFVIADTPQTAFNLSGRDGGRPSPVKVDNLVSFWGHNQTHTILKKFDQKWMVKNNMVFFKKGPKAY